MKRFIFLLVIAALILFSVFKDKGYNAYAGTYEFAGSSNLSLKLNKDNSFIMYYEAGKGSEAIKGKYEVADNNITLTPSKNNIYKFMTDTLHGKVEGKRIKIVELNGDFLEY